MCKIAHLFPGGKFASAGSNQSAARQNHTLGKPYAVHCCSDGKSSVVLAMSKGFLLLIYVLCTYCSYSTMLSVRIVSTVYCTCKTVGPM